ncbi:phage head-tail joining protein [Bordetella bronchiseptica 980-2]|nr:head-tail adaptor protein [Bordetella bronchiseptica]KAK69169.1 phage head-tail joining protein [Bordetella bronchiseptica 980-2]KCV32879.1 phage head-tail joining protein [Bordetella bronchiseptica 00-P-2730]KCV53218.1 phage head-tail joining protein [Bordetella bronchiseptica 3E44]KCV58319.1 phage head-tail joining protein [Bordetella bronchiseptica 980]KDB74293.1 phage head-tail joining protein [Bordetella bronchiseptica B20-10725633]KDB81060.1 phage head-tail joining protein [Bordetell
MLAHRLRHRVTFEAKGEPLRDENGFIIPGTGGWRPVVLADGLRLEDVPAEVLTGHGREFQGGSATQAEVSARVNLRWFPASPTLLASWRLIWDGQIFNIQSAETDATARREWRLRCVDGPSEGQ